MLRIIAMLTLFLLLGCSSMKRYEPTGLTPADFWKEQSTRRTELEMITAKVRLTFRGKERSLSGQGRALLQGWDRSRLELRDPLGRTHLVLASISRDFTAYYPQQKKAFVDKRSGKGFVFRLLKMHSSFLDLEGVLLGLLPRSGTEEMKDWEWNEITAQYRGVIRIGDLQVVCFVDGYLGALRGLLVKSPSGEIEVRYSGFEPCCARRGKNIRLAKDVELTLMNSQTSLQAEWLEIEGIDSPRPDSAFRPEFGKDVSVVALP